MLRLIARAKINWSLDILGRRPDGYHQMDMLMESVTLADELTLEPAEALTLRIVGNDALATENNLVMRAANALRKAYGISLGARMTLIKQVPLGAGMGGGSADAAAALLGLAQLWNLPVSDGRLSDLALALGADVPFQLRGGLMRVGGIGEILRPLPDAQPVSLVVVQPCPALSTGEVFTAYDSLGVQTHPQTDSAQEALLRRNFAALAQTAGNVLQAASEAKRPPIAEAVAALNACGAAFSMMTGSGSAVYGAYPSEADARVAHRLLRKRWRKCWLTETASQSIAFR